MNAARTLFIVAMATTTAACSPSLRTSPLAFGDNVGVYTNGNLRLVTERSRLQPSSGRVLPTVCTEPSPDYAIAFDQSGDITATLNKLGSGDFSFSSKEKTTTLDGRNAGVLALRDGLYAACQSYANGVIGHDAYALILSQYSELIIELVHEQDVTVAAKKKEDADPKDAPAAGSKDKPSPAGAAVPAAPPAAHVSDGTGGATLTLASMAGGETMTLADAPMKNKDKKVAPASGKGTDTSKAAADAEAAKSRGVVYAALLVACISEHDPTRIGGEGGQPKNDMLTLGYCKKFLHQAVKVAGNGLSAR